MIHACSLDEAGRRTVDVHGQPYLLQELVGSAPLRGTYVDGNETNDDARPQGFLVTQPPGSVTPPHFHETDQFQVFVGGGGHFGKKAVSPVTVQFAAGHTPYGPIRAGESGVRYYTLRQRWDPGAKYMPAMRERLVRGRQRQRIGWSAPQALSPGTVADVLAPEADGLLARRYRLGAGAHAAGPDPSTGAGQYQIVLGGALRAGARLYGALSVRYVSGDEPAPALAAGDDGLDLLVLQFPRRPHAAA